MDDEGPTAQVWITISNVAWTEESPPGTFGNRTYRFHAGAPVPPVGAYVWAGYTGERWQRWQVVSVEWFYHQACRRPCTDWDLIDLCEVLVKVKEAPE